MREQIVFLRRAVQRFDLRDRLGLNGYGVLVRVVEDMQLGAVRRADPARLRAVVPKGPLGVMGSLSVASG